MRSYQFETVDVFTSTRFGGNPLAVFPDAQGIAHHEMQAIAAEMNLSETTFVLPPEDPSNTARVRIFNRTAEMPFAGHPTIGTGCVLARLAPARTNDLVLEVPAGLVPVAIERDADGKVTAGRISAPQPLSIGEEVDPQVIAACLGLAASDIVTNVHRPVVASVGNPYVLAHVTLSALGRCQPDLTSFRNAVADRPETGGRFSVYAYARDPAGLRARMFAPLAGTWEDPATGSAATPLGALLLHVEGGDENRLEIHQGLEMGRPSLLVVEARRAGGRIGATVSGGCVPVLQGRLSL